jgi:uncharacterized membrane-anchored protein
MNNLEPQLEHNRKEYDQLNRNKLWVCVAAVTATFPLAILLPKEPLVVVISIMLGSVMIAIVYFEVRRVMVYRRDLRERQRK